MVVTTYDVVTTTYVVVRRRTTSSRRRTSTYIVCRLMHTNNKMAIEITFTMSFWLLVVIITRLANFLVVEIDKLDLDASGFTTCCVVEITWVNMQDSYNNFGWAVTASIDTFGCQQSSLTMFWGWWNHTFYVYQLCTCVYRDVRRRTTPPYDVVRRQTTSCASRTHLRTGEIYNLGSGSWWAWATCNLIVGW